MERGKNTNRGRPVEPREARAHGNDPNAVEIRGGQREAGRTEVRTETRKEPPGREAEPAGVRRVLDILEDRSDGGPDLAPSRRDSVRWGPIWAGLITAITTFLLLQLLAMGLGLVGIGPNNTGSVWVSTMIGLIAFFTGGSVAGMASAVRGAGTGLLNGFLVWALGPVLILLFSALGLGQIFGALGNVVGQLGVLQQLQQGGIPQGAPNVDPAQVAQAVRTGAIGAFFGLLVSALASMLGGLLGGRSSDPIGRPTDARAER